MLKLTFATPGTTTGGVRRLCQRQLAEISIEIISAEEIGVAQKRNSNETVN